MHSHRPQIVDRHFHPIVLECTILWKSFVLDIVAVHIDDIGLFILVVAPLLHRTIWLIVVVLVDISADHLVRNK